MDRRQRKTREAIFRAFTGLLSQNHYSRITVEQIITAADVGRATFYAHFETKDYLLRELSRELFAHVFAARTGEGAREGLFACDASGSAFVHLFAHLANNDNHILDLLCGSNNELFVGYFKTGLTELVKKELPRFAGGKPPALPEDFWVAHIVASFIQTLRWWVEQGMTLSARTITEYFMLAVHAG